MIKRFLLLVLLIALAGCNLNTQDVRLQQQFARYEAYYVSLFDNDRFISFSDAFDLEVVFTKLDSGYRYDVVIDNPKIAMYDIEIMVVENDTPFERADKMMPNLGIFESLEVNLVPYQVHTDKGFMKGVVVSGVVSVSVVELKIMVAWKDYAKLNSTREFFIRNLDYDRIGQIGEENDDDIDFNGEEEEEDE